MLFPAPMPEGFRYQEELITEDEESALAGWIATLALKPFEFHGHLGNRRIASFGLRYDYAKAKVEPAAPIPGILADLRGKVARFAGRNPNEFVQAMATEYAPNAGIGWHRDKPQFGEIVGVSLLSPARLRLRRKHDEAWQRLTRTIQPRSAYLLAGSVRRDWQHSIPPQVELRYSITFRTASR